MTHETAVTDDVFPGGIYRETPIRTVINEYVPVQRDAVEDSRDTLEDAYAANKSDISDVDSYLVTELESQVDLAKTDAETRYENTKEKYEQNLALLETVDAWIDGTLDEEFVPPAPLFPLYGDGRKMLAGGTQGLRLVSGYGDVVPDDDEHDFIPERYRGNQSSGLVLTRDSWANYGYPHLYRVSAVNVVDGGTGFDQNTTYNLEFLSQWGSGAEAHLVIGQNEYIQDVDGNDVLIRRGGYIDSVVVTAGGADYVRPPVVWPWTGGPIGWELEVVMEEIVDPPGQPG